jgi:hypothetical protein
MAPITTYVLHDTATAELDDLIASWRCHMVAQRMSPATLSTYGTSVRQLATFLAERGMPTSPAAITREHVESFITDLLERWKPTTAHNRYRAVGSFWLVDEDEIRTSPMDRGPTGGRLSFTIAESDARPVLVRPRTGTFVPHQSTPNGRAAGAVVRPWSPIRGRRRARRSLIGSQRGAR